MTDNQPALRPDQQDDPPYDKDEINLIDLFRIVWKWKRLIVIGTVICTVAAAASSYLLPKVYLVDMMIAPARIGIDGEGHLIYVDSAELISFKINQGTYDMPIRKALNIDPKEVGLEIRADTGKIKAYERREMEGDPGIIRVMSEFEEKDTGLGVNVLKCLTELLSNDYHPIVQQKKLNFDARITNNKNKIHDIEVQRKDLEKQIQVKMNDVQSRKNQIQIKQGKLEDVGRHIEKLLFELKQVKENAEEIAEKRNKLINKNNKQDDISLMLFGTILQQNITYFNELNNEIYYHRDRQREIESQIDSLERAINEGLGEIERLRLRKDEADQIRIDDTRNEIERLQSEKQIISNIQVLKSPEVSPYPIKPNKKMIVVVTGLAALFAFAFLAFFIEYIKNALKISTSSEMFKT